jgi:hypothetical protein
MDDKTVALGLHHISRKLKQEHSTLAGRKKCKIYGLKTKHHIRRLYDLLKSFCLRPNNPSTPP